MKLSTLITTLAISATSASTSVTAKFINYTTVPGYFIQDDPSTDPSTFDYVRPNLILPAKPFNPTPHPIRTDKENNRHPTTLASSTAPTTPTPFSIPQKCKT
jgi:hypothetical protein